MTLLDELIAIRRDIHQHPEIGFEVQRTAGIAADAMNALGLTVRTEVGQTGVVADLEIPGAKSRIALRADMDALPMQEEGDVPYRSTIPGRAHMCGHDAHTTMLIGAARLLAERRNELKHSVRFIFQPHEEGTPGGAPGMIADGALDGVDEIYALHVWPWLDTGTIGICKGPAMAQSDGFSITIRGRGGHAAAPHQCIDPIPLGAQLVTAFQSIVSRQVDPLESAVISVTQFRGGGDAYNVIPETCFLGGTVRSYQRPIQQLVEKNMRQLAQHLAEAAGATASFDYDHGFPPVINHEQACERAVAASQNLVKVIYPAERAMFGEDFAYYGEKVPACFIQLGCRNEAKGIVNPLHHPRFDIDEDVLLKGAQALASIAGRSS